MCVLAVHYSFPVIHPTLQLEIYIHYTELSNGRGMVVDNEEEIEEYRFFVYLLQLQAVIQTN